MGLARLFSDTGTHFMILDGVQIYDDAEIDRLCAHHNITTEKDRLALWQTLEKAGQRLKDQRRLQIKRTQLSRLKQELRLGLRLSSQLSEHLPDLEQLQSDNPSIGLTRHHLSALREGDRIAADDTKDGSRFRLDDASDTVKYLTRVYEAALSACAHSGIDRQDDPESEWRAELKAFYTRTLARAWVTRKSDQGERFLADCRVALEKVANEASETDEQTLTMVDTKGSATSR